MFAVVNGRYRYRFGPSNSRSEVRSVGGDVGFSFGDVEVELLSFFEAGCLSDPQPRLTTLIRSRHATRDHVIYAKESSSRRGVKSRRCGYRRR